MYLFPPPKKGKLTKERKKHNDDTLALVEAIKSKRHVQISNEEFGFRDTEKVKGSFIIYFEMLTEKRRESEGNLGKWSSTSKHLQEFAKFDITLKNTARTKNKRHLLQNSQSSCYSKVPASLKEAVKAGIIQTNPANQVDYIKPDIQAGSF